MKPSITAIVLTYNEETHIRRCIERLQPLVERIVVVDSFSTDRTVELARELGAEVFERAFVNQAEQFQWALDAIPVHSQWTLRLDADEYFEDSAVASATRQIETAPAELSGIYIRRKFIFRGQWIRFGAYYPVTLLRLWRTGLAHVEQRWMDEHMVLESGTTILLEGGDFVDENLSGITAWTDKHNRYASRHMVDFVGRKYGLIPIEPMPALRSARIKRYLRERVFGGAPLYLRSLLFFLYRYFLRLGFLDGKQGFLWHFLHGFWLFMLIDAKISEAEAFISDHGIDAFADWARQWHGIKDINFSGKSPRLS